MPIRFDRQNIVWFDGSNMSVWGYEILVRNPSPQLLSPFDTEQDWEIFRAAWEEIPKNSSVCWTINIFTRTFVKYYKNILDLFTSPGSYRKARRTYIELVETGIDDNMVLKNPDKLPVVLDDFGTKFSNIDLYISLSPVIVKFDRIFFNLPFNTIRPLVYHFKKQCYFIIIEKVETWEELAWGKVCGFDLYQGFYIDKLQQKEASKNAFNKIYIR